MNEWQVSEAHKELRVTQVITKIQSILLLTTFLLFYLFDFTRTCKVNEVLLDPPAHQDPTARRVNEYKNIAWVVGYVI